MNKRMIDCPECGKHLCPGCSWEIRERGVDTNPECPKCIAACLCKGSGTIPDRRKPTASDRAVERIKALLETFIAIEKPWDDKDTTAVMVLGIIREEADRG